MSSTLASHFLPHAAHRKRAKLLRPEAFAYYILALFLAFSGLRVFAERQPGVLGYASNITVQDLYKYTNEERLSHNLHPLSLSNDLSTAAQSKAKDMFRNNYWAHTSPSGVEPWFFFSSVSYDYSYAGENLAKNFNDSKGVVKAWMNSPSHRDNILSSNYDDVGFAVVNGNLNGYQTTIVVQFFGKRRLPVSAPEVTDQSASVAIDEVEDINPEPASTEAKEASISEFLPEITLSPSAPLVDVFKLSRIFAVILSSFILVLLTLDVWYSSSKGVVKVTGNTLAHMFLLMLTIVGIALVMIPGRVG